MRPMAWDALIGASHGGMRGGLFKAKMMNEVDAGKEGGFVQAIKED